MSGTVRRFVRARWRMRVWVAIAVVFGLASGLFPLFGVLGYELAFAAAILAAVCGLDIGGALAREQARAPHDDTRTPRALVTTTLAAAALPVAILLVPAAIAAVRGLWIPTCDWWFGIVAYVAMPLATAALAGAFGHALGAIAGPRRGGPAVAIAVLPVLVLVGVAVARFYNAPPVFSYSPLVGYFPGNLYDENVKLGAPLAWARLEQLAWVVALVAAVGAQLDPRTYRVTLAVRPRLPALALACAAAAGALALHHASGELGYSIDARDIEDELDGRIETAHFVIHYAHTPDIDRDIELIAEDHEFRYAQVVAQIGAAPAGKLTSFYFADRDQKARWMGARDVEMSKPWRREIYVDHRAFPHGSLRHEIAHAVASEFGDPWFGVAAKRVLGVPALVNPGLIEGLAVALDWPGGYDRLTPHEAVRAMQALGLEPSLDELLSLRFFAVSSARGYTTAGSFLRFLLDTYGAAKLRMLYGNGGDFDAAYGKPIGALEAEWKAMLATIAVPADAVEASREHFRGTSVFARPCPHAIAAAREHAAEAFAGGDRARALALMRDVCHDAPEEPRYRLELGDYLFGGDDAERAEAAALWQRIVDAKDTDSEAEDITSSLRAEAYERLARVAARAGDLTKTAAIIDAAHGLSVDANARRQLDAEAFALADTGPAGAALRGYFFPVGTRSLEPVQWALHATIAEPSLGFAHYLVGLQRTLTGDWADATRELARALDLGLPGPLFVKNAARRLALAAYRAGDAEQVRRAAAVLQAPDMTTVEHLLGADWLARLAFDKRVDKRVSSPRGTASDGRPTP